MTIAHRCFRRKSIRHVVLVCVWGGAGVGYNFCRPLESAVILLLSPDPQVACGIYSILYPCVKKKSARYDPMRPLPFSKRICRRREIHHSSSFHRSSTRPSTDVATRHLTRGSGASCREEVGRHQVARVREDPTEHGTRLETLTAASLQYHTS